MKIVVIGLGSMGRRRIRLIKSLNQEHEIVGVDLSDTRKEQAYQELGILSYSDLATAIKSFSPECAFICTSPASHGEIAIQCLNYGLNIFTEINLLSDWYEKALKIAEEKKLKMFLSSTFLYRKEIEYIKDNIKGNVVNYIYHTGQYLPDWHPWEDYRKFFVGDKRTNGCREIFAIELPWIIETFGEIESFHVEKSKMSTLEINYDDNYIVVFKHKNGNKGVFCLDVLARKAIRSLEVLSENIHMFWNGTPDSLTQYNVKTGNMDSINLYSDITKDERYCANIIENAYTDEILDFFNSVSQNTLSPCTEKYSFAQDFKVLNLIDKIEGKNV